MTTSKIPRVALYVRVSTTDQDVGMQIDELRQVAHQRGWHISSEYVDEGVSGAKTSRPSLDSMMKDARLGRFDLVVVWKLDRLGRSLQHLLRLLDELQGYGVGFVSLRDSGIDTTNPQGRLLLQLLGAFSEFERALIQERVKAGLLRAKGRGIKLGRPERDVDVARARQMLSEGRTQRQISMALRIPRTTLRRALSRT